MSDTREHAIEIAGMLAESGIAEIEFVDESGQRVRCRAGRDDLVALLQRQSRSATITIRTLDARVICTLHDGTWRPATADDGPSRR